jgi:DNA-binding XRE family transcriptional regulator
MNIGAKIRAFRKEKRVTQEELAAYLRISSQAVSKWETGASSPDIDKLICMLWMRRLEADENGKAEIDEQARAMFDFFKRRPIYRRIAEIMEPYWNDGNLMEFYQ